MDPEIVLPVMTGSTEQAMILTRDLGDVRGRRVLVDCTRHRHGMLEFAVALLRILIIDGGAATVAFTDLRDYVDDVVRRPSRSASRTRSARCRGVSSS